MAAHHDFGKAGEEMAAEWLDQYGFQVIFRNWRFARFEVDIIASSEEILHFIEVKSSRDDQLGNPEDWLNWKKGKHLLSAGVAFQDQFPKWTRIQYDILAILFIADRKRDFFL